MIRKEPKFKVIIFPDKHCTHYMDASTDEARNASCLEMVTVRLGQYYFKAEVLSIEQAVLDEVGLSENQVKEMAECRFKDEAIRTMEYAKRSREWVIESNRIFELATKAVELKDGVLAWEVIQDRQEHEHEGYEIEWIM